MKNLLIILSFCGVLIAGCSPVKRTAKLQQQYEDMVNDYIAKHPPRIDTATKYLPGKVDSIYIKVPVSDPVALRKNADSVTRYLREKYSDSLCDAQLWDAYGAGYQQARLEISKTKVADKKPDTIFRTVYNTDAVNNLQKQLAGCNARCAEIDKAKKEKNIWIYTTIAGAVLSGILLFAVAKNLFTRKSVTR